MTTPTRADLAAPRGGAVILEATHRKAGPQLSLCVALTVAVLGFAQPILAADAQPTVADPALESRVLKLSESLRCLVCQNQSIAESQAELALDLRGQVREQLAAGKTEEEVKDYMVARYGDFVLYQPPVKGTTILLWAGPGALMVAGLGWLGWRLASRRKDPAPDLSAEDHARAQAMLHNRPTGQDKSDQSS